MSDIVLVGWKAWYYINGNIVEYCSCETNWHDIPKKGIQVLMKFKRQMWKGKWKDFRLMENGVDYFHLHKDCSNISDPDDPEQKEGELIATDVYEKIFQTAYEDKKRIEEII